MKPHFETVEFGGHSFLRSLSSDCDRFQDDHGWHYHPEYELAYVEAGTGTSFIGDRVESFQAGELFLLGPDIPHCWVSCDESRDNRIRTLQLDPALLGSAFWQLPELESLNKWLSGAERGLHFEGFSRAQLLARIDAVAQGHGAYRVSMFIELLEWLRNLPRQAPLISDFYQLDSENFQGTRMSKVINYVRAHLDADIRQADVAELVGMTTHSFSRFFKASTGRTFVAFVNQLRISEVCRQLESTSDDIADIAFRCGFGNLSNFNRRFAAIKQTTPRAYRQSLQNRDAKSAAGLLL